MNIKKTSVILLLALLCFSVFAEDNANVTTPTIPTSNVYNEKKLDITLTSNTPEFIIKLKSNPSTGYSWFLQEYDRKILVPFKHYYLRPPHNLLGAPGFEIWGFRVTPSGLAVPQKTVIRMIYTQPWQKSEDAAEITFKVTIQ